jgi:uncharacterized membrane protein (UPF0127 family)
MAVDTSSADGKAMAGASGAVVVPEGFATAAVVVRRADGSVCELCTYVAETAEQRGRGLMRVTDLDGRDGMIFLFPGTSADRFWMRNTVMPLTAVWFGPDGAFLDALDMEPCPSDASTCPSYGPGLPASHVLELPLGGADRLGIGAGSVLVSVGGMCPTDTTGP